MRGFGSFALNTRPPRVGRNPKSGEKVMVPEKCVPHFKAGKELRELVDVSPGSSPNSHAGAPDTSSKADDSRPAARRGESKPS